MLSPLSPRLLPALALASALLGASPSAQAQADEGALRVSWDAQPGCPSQRDVHDEIVRLTPSASPAARRSLAARAVAYQAQSGLWSGNFRIEQGEFVGERELQADSCAEIGQAFALSVALALEPTGAPVTPLPDAPLPAATSASSADASEGRPSNAKTTQAPAPSPLRWHVGVGPRFQMGVLPGLAFGFGLDVGASWNRVVRLYANGIFLPERTAALTGLRDAQGSYGFVAGGLTGCASWPLGGLEADVCGRTRWGSLGARSKGVTRESSGRGLYGSAGLAGALRVPLSEWAALRTELEGGAALRRPGFFIEGAGAGYRPTLFYGGASLGAELSFLPVYPRRLAGGAEMSFLPRVPRALAIQG